MNNRKWYLQPIGDFISLLCDADEMKTILQKRFKKDPDALSTLFEIIEKIDEMGYQDGMNFARSACYIASIQTHGNLSLIEIRIRDCLWRVVTYHSIQKKHLVMLDAFENHRGITMNEMIKRIEAKVPVVRRLLEEVD